MANRKAAVTQADVKRYVAAVLAAGVRPGKIEIAPDGTVTIYPADAPGFTGANPCDILLE